MSNIQRIHPEKNICRGTIFILILLSATEKSRSITPWEAGTDALVQRWAMITVVHFETMIPEGLSVSTEGI
jgi:hypothetical protein